MLTLKNVRKTFNKGTINEKKALNGINLHLDSGDFVTIIGGNGAGKSTTLNMIAGICKGKIYRQSFSGPYERNCGRHGNS